MKRYIVIMSLMTAGVLFGQQVGYAEMFPQFRVGSQAATAVSAKDRLKSSIRDIYKSPCQMAFSSYNSVKSQYDAKKAICNEMDAAAKNRDKYGDIGSALTTMLFGAPGGAGGSCGNYIGTKRDEYSAMWDAASDLFWDKWEQCNFDGPSISALESSLSAAESGVCTACSNAWPGPADSDSFIVHCD